MAEEFTPAAMHRILARAGIETAARNRTSIAQLAQVIERQAAQNASTGSHKYGTATPAWRGGGPSVISGDLRRSITHTPIVPMGLGFTTRVGPASIPHRTYGKSRHGTTSGVIGEALETKIGYPFLLPAWRWGVQQTHVRYAEVFGLPWGHL